MRLIKETTTKHNELRVTPDGVFVVPKESGECVKKLHENISKVKYNPIAKKKKVEIPREQSIERVNYISNLIFKSKRLFKFFDYMNPTQPEKPWYGKLLDKLKGWFEKKEVNEPTEEEKLLDAKKKRFNELVNYQGTNDIELSSCLIPGSSMVDFDMIEQHNKDILENPKEWFEKNFGYSKTDDEMFREVSRKVVEESLAGKKESLGRKIQRLSNYVEPVKGVDVLVTIDGVVVNRNILNYGDQPLDIFQRKLFELDVRRMFLYSEYVVKNEIVKKVNGENFTIKSVTKTNDKVIIIVEYKLNGEVKTSKVIITPLNK